MRVKFVKYHPMFAHSIGDITTLSDENTDALLASGHVVASKESPETATIKPAESAVIKPTGHAKKPTEKK